MICPGVARQTILRVAPAVRVTNSPQRHPRAAVVRRLLEHDGYAGESEYDHVGRHNGGVTHDRRVAPHRRRVRRRGQRVRVPGRPAELVRTRAPAEHQQGSRQSERRHHAGRLVRHDVGVGDDADDVLQRGRLHAGASRLWPHGIAMCAGGMAMSGNTRYASVSLIVLPTPIDALDTAVRRPQGTLRIHDGMLLASEVLNNFNVEAAFYRGSPWDATCPTTWTGFSHTPQVVSIAGALTGQTSNYLRHACFNIYNESIPPGTANSGTNYQDATMWLRPGFDGYPGSISLHPVRVWHVGSAHWPLKLQVHACRVTSHAHTVPRSAGRLAGHGHGAVVGRQRQRLRATPGHPVADERKRVVHVVGARAVPRDPGCLHTDDAPPRVLWSRADHGPVEHDAGLLCVQ